ncbi:cytochrome c oxidase accessory protein CcoG [Chryseobacterium carnipullorum]|uniref:Cytochrome c oxidase accessory protein CcoG n=1 Tax=Chryseobacterium carnipullorum TaxID=1124835 RepID=A0A376E703_CHRCU|nr:cytochrome c oxidase accessory protein CcoG [Chryseobacterium carnipullorum]
MYIMISKEEKAAQNGEIMKTVKQQEKEDCIDCHQCVVVCPTGIDIRNGQQLECVNCTACIDACDEVMEKVGLPKGLVRYATEAEIENQETFQIYLQNESYHCISCFTDRIFRILNV